MYSEIAFGHDELKTSFPETLEDCLLVSIIYRGVLAAMPIASTFCGHWSALMTGPRYSQMKLEKADKEQLNPCANLGYANVRFAKLIARSSIDCWSALRRQ